LYQKTGQKAGYIRQAGFDPLQQEQMIMSYIWEHKVIKRANAADLCRIGPHQATRLLTKLAKEGKIILKGSRKGSFYERNS
jgi:ATP-dependent DNA helicase RecG